MKRVLRENSLSLGFGLLMILTLVGQSLAGLADYNDQARTDGMPQLSWPGYVTSSAFGVDVAENWQSEYLQFTLYILLTVWLVQRGSSESKRPEEAGFSDDEKERIGGFAEPGSPRWAAAGGWRTWLYSFSLTAMMALVFLLSWAAQAVAGRAAANEERLRDLLDPMSLGGYLASPDFWSRTTQNWQSEFLAVGSMAIFAVFLRQRGSPESKAVGAPHEETG